jgi:hypothetical protein
MTKREIIEENEDEDSTLLFADGFDEAIVGVGEQFNNRFVVYDRDKCIDILMKRDGMDYEGAEEFFEFNVTGAWVGESTPVFVRVMEGRDG